MSVRGPTTAILFFASPKKSIQKKGDPDAALILRSEAFERGCRKGLLPLRQRDASLHRPCGLNRSKAPVLGAAYGRKTVAIERNGLFAKTDDIQKSFNHLLGLMKTTPIVLDHLNGIALDPSDPPFNNYQAFAANYEGLKILAGTVRELEIQYAAKDPYAAHVVLHINSQVPALVPCAFNWFSVTLVNYLRLVGLVQLMSTNNWKSSALADPSNRSTIRAHCTNFVKTAVPEVYLWRNKVAAHFAATDPFHDDNIGTLEQSIMNPVTYKFPHYHVSVLQWNTAGETSQLPSWALTKVYEDLSARFWPGIQLNPVPGTET